MPFVTGELLRHVLVEFAYLVAPANSSNPAPVARQQDAVGSELGIHEIKHDGYRPIGPVNNYTDVATNWRRFHQSPAAAMRQAPVAEKLGSAPAGTREGTAMTIAHEHQTYVQRMPSVGSRARRK